MYLVIDISKRRIIYRRWATSGKICDKEPAAAAIHLTTIVGYEKININAWLRN
jgi:hypothetical protein